MACRIQAALAAIIELVLIAASLLILWLGGREWWGRPDARRTHRLPGYLGFLVQPIRVFTSVVSSMQLGLRRPGASSASWTFPGRRIPGEPGPSGCWKGASPPERHLLLREAAGAQDISSKSSREKVALVGPRSGKSTLATHPRFYDPDSEPSSWDGATSGG